MTLHFLKNRSFIIPTLLFILIAGIYYYSSPGSTVYDHFVRLADAFARGRLFIDPCPEYL